ncbi:MAG: glycosyltransferase [Thiobacillus sp.]
MFGNGFEIPPAQSPYPNFRTWEKIRDSRLIKSERLALATINAVCRAHRQAPLHAVHEIFFGATQALITLPELDHYGTRAADYLGPVHAQLGGARVAWPEGEGKRILAYLRPNVPGFHAMVAALKIHATPTILIVPNAPKAWVEQHASQTFTIQTGSIQIEPLLKACSLGISYGGSGTLSQFGLAGVPQLVLLKNVEQYMGAVRVAQLGVAIVLEQARKVEDLAPALDQMLNEARFQHASREFAKRYAKVSPEQAVAGVVRKVEQSQLESLAARSMGAAATSVVVH